MNKKIFKTYDIRGIYPKELDEETFYKIGQAFVRYQMSDARCRKSNVGFRRSNIGGRIAVGRDVRDSSLSLSRAFIKGVLSQGATVIDLGIVTTSMVYFSVVDDNLDGGAMITASHNPKEYNGIKLIDRTGVPISKGSGLEEIEKWSLRCSRIVAPRLCSPRTFSKSIKPAAADLLAMTIKKDITYDYINYILSFVAIKKIKPLKIVLDASGGVAGGIATAIFSQLPCKITKMNFWPHDKYPDHSLNPILEESQKSISKEIKKQKADLGVIWDGDGDRVIFFDEKGRFIHPYYMTALLVKIILKQLPLSDIFPPIKGGQGGILVLHDSRLYWLIKEETEKYGGELILFKAGRTFFEKRMTKGDIIFGAEASGHYYFYKDFCLGDGFIPLLLVLEYLSKTKKSPCTSIKGAGASLSSLINPYRKKYFISGEINVKLEVRNEKLGVGKRKLKVRNQKFLFQSLISNLPSNGKISYLDGLSIEYPNWRFNLRLSETEPLLRLNIEARNKRILEEKKKKVLSLISLH